MMLLEGRGVLAYRTVDPVLDVDHFPAGVEVLTMGLDRCHGDCDGLECAHNVMIGLMVKE